MGKKKIQDKDKALHIADVMPSFDSPLNWKEYFKDYYGHDINHKCFNYGTKLQSQ